MAVSNKIAKTLKTLNSNVITIYPAVSLKNSSDTEKQKLQKYFSSKNNLTIAQVGNFVPVKNFSLTIKLASKFPQIDFFLVGKGEMEDELKLKAKNLKNVTFIPFTPHVDVIFQNVDLNIVPSLNEGFSLVVIESFLCNTPTIAHKTGGLEELIIHNKTGFLIENNEFAKYERTLNYILQNPSCLNEFKNNIKDFLSKNNFSHQRLINQYKELFNRV